MKRIYPFLAIFFFILLFTYAFLHTWEYDEAWTWLSVKDESFFDLVAYKHFNIANHHLLNSIWFKLMQLAGFKHVIFYRLISLISYCVYSFFLWKAVTYKVGYWRPRADGWLLLFFVPPIMIYFTLGRGYAMATAGFVASLYYMKAWLNEKKASDYWKFFLFGTISCLAIVSFLFPFIAMLVYMVFRSDDKLFAKRNIITGVLLLPLVLYIYYVGKTIILHDKIINGTDHLFVNGMYATFFGFLGIYDFVFPCPDLLARLDLVLISKVLVPLSFLPVVLIMLRRRGARSFSELTVLVFTTLMFLASHILLKAKYPSDRSVIYLLYLLYIPIVLYIVKEKNKFFKIHYFVVLTFSLINFCSFFYALTRPEFYSVMKAKPVRSYTILSDWQNWGDDVYNELYFNGRLQVSYIAKSFETDWDKVDQTIRAAVKEPKADYLLLQRSTWLRDQDLFKGLPVEKLMSSSYREMYLIQLK